MDRQLLLDQTPAQISLGIHDVSKFLQIVRCGPADDSIAIFRPRFHFPNCGGKARFDLLARFGSTFCQPAPQFVYIWWHDKNIDERLTDEFVFRISNRIRALGVDVDQNIAAVH